MSVESATEVQDGEEFDAIREAVGPDAEITAVIDGTSSLHQQDVVVGEVADYGVSQRITCTSSSFIGSKDDRLHCIISDDQRADITTSIRDGKRVAVTGDLTFYAPRSRCSIEVDDVVPADGDDNSHSFERLWADRRIQIAIATVLVVLAVVPSWYCKKHKRTPDTDAIKVTARTNEQNQPQDEKDNYTLFQWSVNGSLMCSWSSFRHTMTISFLMPCKIERICSAFPVCETAKMD